jgi:hypothetical protein
VEPPESFDRHRATTDGTCSPLNALVSADQDELWPDPLVAGLTHVADLLVKVHQTRVAIAQDNPDSVPRVREEIERLQRAACQLQELSIEAASGHRRPARAQSPGSCDRGEWVAAGMRR